MAVKSFTEQLRLQRAPRRETTGGGGRLPERNPVEQNQDENNAPDVNDNQVVNINPTNNILAIIDDQGEGKEEDVKFPAFDDAKQDDDKDADITDEDIYAAFGISNEDDGEQGTYGIDGSERSAIVRVRDLEGLALVPGSFDKRLSRRALVTRCLPLLTCQLSTNLRAIRS